MAAKPDDWRRDGQHTELPPGTPLYWRRYRALSETWEHEHCVFCFAKFMDPDFSEAHRVAIEADPEIFTAGYSTARQEPVGAGVWICPTCTADFAEEFQFRLNGSDEDTSPGQSSRP